MANLDLLENSIPVAPLKLAALPGSMEMAKKVDSYLVQFRKELAERRNGVSFSGYSEDSFLIDCECPRFGSGEAKGKINESVRGADLYIIQSRYPVNIIRKRIPSIRPSVIPRYPSSSKSPAQKIDNGNSFCKVLF